jgi:hypothetical protein
MPLPAFFQRIAERVSAANPFAIGHPLSLRALFALVQSETLAAYEALPEYHNFECGECSLTDDGNFVSVNAAWPRHCKMCAPPEWCMQVIEAAEQLPLPVGLIHSTLVPWMVRVI